jgi:hypothetical protein
MYAVFFAIEVFIVLPSFPVRCVSVRVYCMSRARTQPIDFYIKRTSFSFAGMRKIEGEFLTLQRNNV